MALSQFKNLFKVPKLAVIGMVHLKPLPGTPSYSAECSVDEIVQDALEQSQIYAHANVDGIILENMHDVPYVLSKKFGPEVTATMTRIANEIRASLPETMPCGIQVLSCGNQEAVAVSKAANLQFIRCEGYVFSHIADEGWVNGCAGELQRYAGNIGAENVLVFADVKKKHSSHTVTKDISIADMAKAAEFFKADGIIVTGESTGHEPDHNEVKEVGSATELPVILGSGITTDNVENFSNAHGLIVGSYFKKNGRWDGSLSMERIKKFMEKVSELRK